MRLHTAFFGLLLLTSSTHADPGWWEARGVISTTPAANLAPANIGQAKHMAAIALAELQGQLPAASHQALQADVALIVDLSLPDPLPPGYHETQRAVLFNGQLKAIAKPFYDHLRTHNATWLDNAMTAGNLVVMEPGSNPLTPSPYPWSVATTDDANRAPATLGQLKAVFSLPLETLTDISTTLDTDGDGMTDAWEIQYSLNPNDPSDANTDADNDGFSNLQESQTNSNPTNASSIPGDRDGDSLADDLDAVPDDAEINWKKSPECHYVWIEQVTGGSTSGGAPKHVNARGQILFEYSHPNPPIYETYPEETLDNVLWDSTSQAWIPLATSGSGNSGKVIELFGLSDQGFVFGASHTFSDFQPDSPSVNSAGMIWKPSASSPNTYLPPTHFMPDVVNRVSSGVDWRGTVSNDGIANCTTFRSNTTGAWETYNGSSTSPNLTTISGLGNEDRVPGAILDATTSLMLLKSYQPGSSWSLKLYDGSQVADVDGLLPADNLGNYTPATDINITPSLKTNGQRRLWLSAHYYASGAYHYPVRIEKRAGGTGAARWHQPPSMAEGAWKLNARGEAIKSAKIWRNGTYTDLNTITSKSDTITIIQAIDLASNGIILAQAEGNGENKIGLLFPIDLISDLNNDGQITAADNALRDAAMASGASDTTKDNGTEYLFINDKMSNGIWDADDDGVTSYSYGSGYSTMPKPPATHKDDDDAEPLRVQVGGLNSGVVWFDHPTIDKLEFFNTKECKAGDKLNITSASPFDLITGKLPETIYMRLRDDWAGTDQPGNLRMFVGKNVNEIWAKINLQLTVVRDFGSAHFFHAARDYILENNSRMCIRDHGYPFGPNPDTIFRLCVMREEATKMTAFDSTAGGEKGIEMSYYAIPAAKAPAVIINGNQCFWTAGWDEKNPLRWPDMNDEIADKCHGRVISGSVTATTSSDNFDTNTTPAKGSPLAGPDPLGNFPGPDGIIGTADDITNPDALSAGGKYIGCNSGAWTFAAGWARGSDALGGLSTNYASYERIDKSHQLVGYATGMETGKGCIFTATQIKGEGYGPIIKGDASIAGVPALSPSADSGAIKLLILDCGAGSLALMHIDPTGTMRGAYMGRKTSFGFPYYVNNYLALDPAPARP